MIKNITMGQYIPGNSILHRADPRTKIIWTFLLLIALFTANNIYGYVMMLALVGIILVVSEIPVKYTLRGIKPLLIILILTAVINIFAYQGNTVLVSVGSFKITLEGILQAVIVAVRLSLMVIIGSILTFTTTPIQLTDGLEKLMRPLKKIKVPVHEMAMMMSIALRFIPTLLEETDRIIKAQSSRGADFDTGNFIERAKSFIPVLIPLFVSAFKRAEELATAMEARCYRGDIGRTRMKELAYTRVDRNIHMFLIAFSIVFIISTFVI
ncbi:cobalt transporter permease protein CbiQ [Thermoclostridium stercorarium subsp. stercorarium DSM 8532]|jgi:energy-coupling factor transport system permease protein|uniref:Energy-coupling factor transporter transmembrane protein EcfT n=3 Tax=Thermoclostridium stercorarium TaxID=1510 RepID=L7VS03_THES1|nr:energy-coupling factor transporter transmembrane component T [Thermoclostridium stercorarium]AGC69562.1 cobalt transporter permease protein CbiQ [Thermoclostridium stercorarium subsp. stercorarium DSM 8532]AGI40514.1 ABC transporter permease subunit [Thermoclostridium stercorarium subsp. stercorarium DSM 8532]ANW99793.1 transporter [Thermoclostridium stercorarium subsp. thermolacticum DSM 2910]ANX02420.1 transporter [Thermoclostridium stercorarium subsp. leptospartum DSM 9219]UZQ85503.1 ene